MKTKFIVLVAIFPIYFLACSTAQVRVLPGEDTHRSVARDKEKDGAQMAAAKAALKYCKERGQEAIVMSDSSHYDGKMDEGTRDGVRKASRAAMVLGNVGGIVNNAGAAGYFATNDRDYESEVKFRCK